VAVFQLDAHRAGSAAAHPSLRAIPPSAPAPAKLAPKPAFKAVSKPAAKAADAPTLPKPAPIAKPKTPAAGDEDWETF
jgi:hypothetical protein